MNTERFQDKCRGALVGGAVGDALGYPVEFIYSFKEIQAKYGEGGITEYDRQGLALFSDDTQMTLYTAEGLLAAEQGGKPIVPMICDAYLAWFGHQVGKKVKIAYDSALAKIDELNQRRAPGNTCISALLSIYGGKEPENYSKGCGGVMRVAPVGLYGASRWWTLTETAKLAGDAAELTHLHPLSTYSSAALAVIVQQCAAAADPIDRLAFKAIVGISLDVVSEVYGADAPAMDEFQALVGKAVQLADSPLPDWQIIEGALGEGWVGEEALAIAVFSVIRHIDDFSACMACAVNHGGDSDSTGAVAGNIIGAILGCEALPEKYTNYIQLKDILLSTADALCAHN